MMKYQQSILLGSALVFLYLASFGSAQLTTASPGPLTLKVRSEKQSYLLGEPVELSFALTNVDDKDIPFGCFGIGTGDIQLFVSKDKKEFLEYDAGWGTVDAICNNLLKPGDKLEISHVKILWNRKIKESDQISPDVIRHARQGKIVNDYAFSESGNYYLQARIFTDGITKLESDPIKITISKPTGDDLQVWNRIKDRGDMAFFIQNAHMQVPDYKPEERAKFLQDVEWIMIDHPNSFYAGLLKQSLDTMKAADLKREEFMQRIQDKNPQ